MILRIYKRNINNKNELINIKTTNHNTLNKNIKRYLNLIKESYNNKIEVYTEHYNLLYESNEYIIVSYNKIVQDNDLFPNLKEYSYDKNINYQETKINNQETKINNQETKINNIKLIKEIITFLEIDLNDNFIESYTIETLLDQIKLQILNHK
jgi:hypothetical protein